MNGVDFYITTRQYKHMTNPITKTRMVIFDFDGVIIDSLKIIEKFDQWLYPGLTEEEWRETNYGNYFQKMQPHEHKRRVVTAQELKTKRQDFYDTKAQANIFPGMRECIVRIPKNIVCVLNTNSKLEGCIPFLTKHALTDQFAFLATKEVSTSKKEKLELSLQKYQVLPEDVLFITDTIGDLLEGRAVGIPVIAVTWGTHSKQDFLEYKPYQIVQNSKELSATINKFLAK